MLVGGTGYIGSALYEGLKDEYEVEVTGKKDLDVTNEESIINYFKDKTYDLIVYLVAETETKDEDKMFDVNVDGATTFFKQVAKFQETHLPYIIYISSMMRYSEEGNWYGFCKKQGEFIFEKIIQNGTIIRLPGVFGGNRKSGYIYNLIQQIKEGKEEIIEIENEDMNFWQTIYIDDVVSMLKEFIQNYDFPLKINEFDLCYTENTDFIKTAYCLKTLLNSPCYFVFQKNDYNRFRMKNDKIMKYININEYSYIKSLTKYVNELS